MKEARAIWVLLVLVVVAGVFPQYALNVERVKIMHVTMSFNRSSPPSIHPSPRIHNLTMESTPPTSLRPSLDNPESNVHIDKANKIVQDLQSAKLYTTKLQDNFQQKVTEFKQSDPTSDDSSRRHPADIASEVASQVVCIYNYRFVSCTPTNTYARHFCEHLNFNTSNKMLKTSTSRLLWMTRLPSLHLRTTNL